ncbi:hypothetical protein AVEN_260353-1, partial [Araneus ventricosus]
MLWLCFSGALEKLFYFGDISALQNFVFKLQAEVIPDWE